MFRFDDTSENPQIRHMRCHQKEDLLHWQSVHSTFAIVLPSFPDCVVVGLSMKNKALSK